VMDNSFHVKEKQMGVVLTLTPFAVSEKLYLPLKTLVFCF
jgi:hypothetical protein